MSGFSITSSAFAPNTTIPSKHSCEGADVSPALAWTAPPPGAKSLVLIVDDPDAPDPAAPRTTWVHWVLINISPETRELVEDAGRKGLPQGSVQGVNDWKRAGWGGPCPPIGEHRYFFKLYALDTALDLERPTKADVEKVMQDHVIAHAQLIGRYRKHQAR